MADLTDKTDDIAIWDEGRTKSVDLMTDVDGKNRFSVETVPSILTPSAQNISQFVRAGKVFSLTDAVNAASASSENPIFLLKNPSGSGKTFYIYKFSANMNVTNVGAKFGIYANPTITTNGTSMTPANQLIGGGASAATAFKLSTVSAPGTLLQGFCSGSNVASFRMIDDCGIILPANNNLLITCNPVSNHREAVLNLVWVEL